MKTNLLIGKLAAAALAIALIIPGSAQAYPKQGWYIGAGAGVNFLQDNDAKIGATTNRIEADPGFLLDGSIGFGFESQLRPEFEIAYRRNTVDKVSGTGAGTSTGNFDSVAFMGNLFYDFQTNSGVTPYLGIGAGGALIGANDAGRVFGGNLFNNSPFEFAYQGIAGLSYELSERWDVTADYRYFATLDPEYKTAAGGFKTNEAEYRNHSFLLGLRYVFGVEREVPTPVAMRAQPRAVQVVPAQRMMMVQQQQPMMQQVPPPPPVVPETYIVFFDFDKTYLTAEAKETIQRAADAFRRGGVARVQVTGHTDTRGSSRYNKRLSERRASMVQGYMISLGIPRDEITTRGAGEGELMVPTANNVREAKNRRAEIVLVQ